MPAQYIPRIIEGKLAGYLSGLPAVAIEGAKGVGKTTMAARLAKTVYMMDSPEASSLVIGSPELLRQADKPLLIDEWQLQPAVWDMVRRSVDDDGSPGQYILAGSAVPIKARVHSGAGRIVRMLMRPLSLAERKLADTRVSINELLKGRADIHAESIGVAQHEYVREILASGLPGIRSIDERFRAAALDGYIANIVERNLDEIGVTVRQPAALMAWLRAYAAATASTASYNAIMQAATPAQDNKPSKPTTMAYRDALSAMWMLDPIEPWLPLGNTFSNLGQSPKHYLVDPALSARVLGITEARLLAGETVRVIGSQARTLIGSLFESLIAQSLKVYADSLGLAVKHLRTSSGAHEVDFIIEDGGTVLAIEAKFSTAVHDSDTKHLNWLEKSLPEFEVVKMVAYTGQHLYRRSTDGVIVAPAAVLGV